MDLTPLTVLRLVRNTYYVTATLSRRGQIVIPQVIRDRCELREGDHFIVEDDPSNQIVTLRKVKLPGDWFDVYMQCPASFDIPRRRRKFPSRRDELGPHMSTTVQRLRSRS
jgi:AbrB family looped-hinge helix DNA binding protein